MKNENKNTLSAFEELENIKSRYYKRLNLNSKLSLAKNNIIQTFLLLLTIELIIWKMKLKI